MKSAAMKTTKAMKAKAAMDAMKIEGDEGQGGHLRGVPSMKAKADEAMKAKAAMNLKR